MQSLTMCVFHQQYFSKNYNRVNKLKEIPETEKKSMKSKKANNREIRIQTCSTLTSK